MDWGIGFALVLIIHNNPIRNATTCKTQSRSLSSVCVCVFVFVCVGVIDEAQGAGFDLQLCFIARITPLRNLFTVYEVQPFD